MPTVLLVDDDQDDLDLLKEAILERHAKLHCMCFDNSLEAMRVITEELVVVPDYIFIDINMPLLRGDDMLVILRRQPAFTQTVITILSTGMSDITRKVVMDQGASHAFKKPDKFAGYTPILSAVIG